MKSFNKLLGLFGAFSSLSYSTELPKDSDQEVGIVQCDSSKKTKLFEEEAVLHCLKVSDIRGDNFEPRAFWEQPMEDVISHLLWSIVKNGIFDLMYHEYTKQNFYAPMDLPRIKLVPKWMYDDRLLEQFADDIEKQLKDFAREHKIDPNSFDFKSSVHVYKKKDDPFSVADDSFLPLILYFDVYYRMYNEIIAGPTLEEQSKMLSDHRVIIIPNSGNGIINIGKGRTIPYNPTTVSFHDPVFDACPWKFYTPIFNPRLVPPSEQVERPICDNENSDSDSSDDTTEFQSKKPKYFNEKEEAIAHEKRLLFSPEIKRIFEKTKGYTPETMTELDETIHNKGERTVTDTVQVIVENGIFPEYDQSTSSDLGTTIISPDDTISFWREVKPYALKYVMTSDKASTPNWTNGNSSP